MLNEAIDNYLTIRRAAGFELKVDEGLLRNYARLAMEHGKYRVLVFHTGIIYPCVSTRNGACHRKTGHG